MKQWVALTDKRVITCYPTLKHRRVRRSVFGGNGDCSIFVPTRYMTMLISGKIKDHLEEVDKSAEEMFEQLIVQMKEQEGVTEVLKANNQLAWVQQMNNIRNRVSEIVYKELIYV